MHRKTIDMVVNYILVMSLLSLVFVGVYIYVWYTEDKDIIEIVEEIKEETEVKPIIRKESGYPMLDMDFLEYRKVNEDVKGWLHITGVDLSLPLVQTGDNDFYLNHDVYKKPNKLGWIFVDARSSLIDSTQNTVIYGHNTSTGKMFGSLKKFLEMDVTDETKYVQMGTTKDSRLYEIFSVYVTHEDDWSYIRSDFTKQGYRNFLKEMKERNENPTIKTSIDGVSEIVTFSTCYGRIGTDKRLVIHAKIVTKERR